MPQKKKRISSVLELGRYKAGQLVYWVTFRKKNVEPIVDEEDEWMFDCHPKKIYQDGPYRKLWNHNLKLPKLHHEDFKAVVSLLQTELVIEEFNITDITRSNLTGDYYYSNEHSEWMPQQNLFDTTTAARRERNRIAKLISKWADSTTQG